MIALIKILTIFATDITTIGVAYAMRTYKITSIETIFYKFTNFTNFKQKNYEVYKTTRIECIVSFRT